MSRVFFRGLILIAIILIAIPACNRKSTGNEDIFAELEGGEGVYILKIPVVLFNGIAASELFDGENIEDLGDVEVVKLLMFDQKNAKNITTVEISKRILDRLNEIGYEEIIQVSSSGMSSSAYVLDDDDYISDLMVVVTENESVIGIGLSGKLDFKSISKFATELDYGKLKNFIQAD